MNPTLLTIYILIWPVICIGLLGVLIVSAIKDWRKARKEGRSLV